MVCNTFKIRSTRGDVDLACYEWLPEGTPSAVLQVHHGMTSHATYFEGLAEYLTRFGFAVYGYDCLGHGRTEGTRGFFADKGGDRVLVEDMHHAMKEFKGRSPGVPYFIIGHSMGSFILRMFITRYGNEIDGAVLLSTGSCSPFRMSATIGMLKAYSVFVGRDHPCAKLHARIDSGYDRKYRTPEGMPSRWLSRDPAALSAMNADPLCDFAFTVEGFIALMTLMRDCARYTGAEDIPKQLPILLVSGDEDCIGGFGKDIVKISERYAMNGQTTAVKLYAGRRHDLFSDTGNEEVYRDIKDWMRGLIVGP